MPKKTISITPATMIESTDIKGVYFAVKNANSEVLLFLQDLAIDNRYSWIPKRLRALCKRYNSGERLSRNSFKILKGGDKLAEFIIASYRFVGFFYNEKFILCVPYPKKGSSTPKTIITKVKRMAKLYAEENA